VAAVRRKLRQNLIMASRCTAPGDCLAAAEAVKIAAHRRIHSAHFGGAAVDNAGARSLYTLYDAPPASARWRVCEAPHCLR
jgi:hypothetical protein